MKKDIIKKNILVSLTVVVALLFILIFATQSIIEKNVFNNRTEDVRVIAIYSETNEKYIDNKKIVNTFYKYTVEDKQGNLWDFFADEELPAEFKCVFNTNGTENIFDDMIVDYKR